MNIFLKLMIAITPINAIEDAAQQHAKKEADMMAERQVCEHLLGCAKGATFSGVGRSRSPKPSTCVPWEHGSRARKVVADAIVYRDGFYYRSTHWR